MLDVDDSRPELLVSAGEASGDSMAAEVLERLSVSAYGLGGMNLRRAGANLHAAFSSRGEMGFFPVAARSAQIGRAYLHLCARARTRRPRAALLVGYSELNARLGRTLRQAGTPVLWIAPPQVWAWRARRAPKLASCCTRMAVLLPFEPAVWRRAGADAVYIGHPAAVRASWPGAREARSSVSPTVALLPGSRPHEVRAHLDVLLAAVQALRSRHAGLRAKLVPAPSLDPKTQLWMQRRTLAARVETSTTAAKALDSADVAIVASGTATVDAVAAGVPPVIVYRTDPPTWLVARSLVRVSCIGLPNLVLGERAFFELLQHDVTPARIAQAVGRTLDRHPAFIERCKRARDRLSPPGPCSPAQHAANLLLPWLSRSP